MFENPIAIFLFVLILGMYLVNKANDLCDIGDLFTGRAFSWNHQVEHINREFNGFTICLTLAVAAFLISMAISAVSEAQMPAPKRVFIQDLEKGSKLPPQHKQANASHHPTGGTNHKGNHQVKQQHSQSHLLSPLHESGKIHQATISGAATHH